MASKLKLNFEQIETCVKNLAKIRHFKKVEKIYDGDASYKESVVNELKKLNIKYNKITKFADRYIIYKFSNVEKNSPSVNLIKEHNPDAKICNLEDRIEFVIVVDSDKIDRQNYMAIESLYPLIHNDLMKNKNFKFSPDSDKFDDSEYYVTICPSNHIEEAMKKHFNIKFIPCNYKFFSLYDVAYPLIGSKSSLWCGFVFGYETIKYEKLYNNYKYAVIYNYDPVVKLLNAKDNDLIIAMQTMIEGRPYIEFVIKQIKPYNEENDDEDNI